MDDIKLGEANSAQALATRQRVLMALKQRGGLTAAALAAALGITGVGVRRHLTGLERDRLVAYDVVPGGRGRPSYVYRLTPQAEGLFPKNYAGLAVELLGYVGAEGGEAAVGRLFEQRARRRIRQAQAQLAGLPLAQRVAGLARILADEGYLAEWRQEDAQTFWLAEGNCAVHDVAQAYSAACSSELIFLQAILPDAQITRVHHLLRGELVCAYRIRQRTPEAAGG